MRPINFVLIWIAFVAASCNLPLPTEIQLPIPSTATVTPAPTESPVPPTATSAPISHLMKPSVGDRREAIAHDTNEALIFENRHIEDGDFFSANLFERPFATNMTEYLPYIDIKDFYMFSDANWYYSEIILSGMNAERFVRGTFGLEFDLNVDGRAETLVFVEDPFLDWSVERVRVYLDGDGDIGGTRSGHDELYSGNGYETLLFDSGFGADPDLAWARLENGRNPKINIAVKRSLFGDYGKFMWSVFASEANIDPSKFYINDQMTEENAGSPNRNSDYYPIKGISAFDNTCRIPIGFQSDKRLPLGCSGGGSPTIKWTPRDINWCAVFVCPQP